MNGLQVGIGISIVILSLCFGVGACNYFAPVTTPKPSSIIRVTEEQVDRLIHLLENQQRAGEIPVNGSRKIKQI